LSPDADSGGPSLTVRAPAKVNLYLEVLGRRPDGYHEIRTVMQTVSLWDELRISVRDDGQIHLDCADPAVPQGQDNLVCRAASVLKERFGVERGARIQLRKHIPVGGGLGGGSSDCASTLQALVQLWHLQVAQEELHEIAGGLGADVPFFLEGGTALCEGKGEKVTPIACPGTFHYVLVMPGFPVWTREVYEKVERCLTTTESPLKNVVLALEEGDARLLGCGLYNGLQEAAFEVSERLRGVWEEVQALSDKTGGVGLVVCGAGSTILSLYRSRREAQRALKRVIRGLSLPCVAIESLPASGSAGQATGGCGSHQPDQHREWRCRG